MPTASSSVDDPLVGRSYDRAVSSRYLTAATLSSTKAEACGATPMLAFRSWHYSSIFPRGNIRHGPVTFFASPARLNTTLTVSGELRAVAGAKGGVVDLDGHVPRPGLHDHRRVRAGVEAGGPDRPEQEGARRVAAPGSDRRARGERRPHVKHYSIFPPSAPAPMLIS